jgi:hypothetical protein
MVEFYQARAVYEAYGNAWYEQSTKRKKIASHLMGNLRTRTSAI